MEKFTKTQVQEIKDKLNLYLKEFTDYSAVVTSASYEDYEIDFKLVVKPKATEDFDPEYEKFKDYVLSLPNATGLIPEDFGKEVTIDGKKFTICGCNPRSKYDIIVKNSNDTRYTVASYDISKQLRG